jgi:hypothetical protein
MDKLIGDLCQDNYKDIAILVLLSVLNLGIVDWIHFSDFVKNGSKYNAADTESANYKNFASLGV